ncbi:glycerate kinase [Kutzneria albida]|uniref:Glycerate kinase n=1 Tax=Kutzneria albida DSM 43870 TaxID=1449976 RepID=W5WAQ2_9PSEU|nr:glycerate kinase [Kutzneria albida]AHH97835.1 hypothetical protein KALB_4473 [Kutzneria albida DSM 43870]
MRVLLAPDKFKGSLTASAVADHLAAGLRRAAPGLDLRELPIADGGEGTVDAACAAGYHRVTATVTGPLGLPVRAALAVRGPTAVIELAQAAGLSHGTAPLTATSYGVGELIRLALDRGCGRIVLGVGGSASTDGGAGMVHALGARLINARGPGGAALRELTGVDLSGLDPRLRTTRFVLASDVDNPLREAAPVYAPQKGATALEVSLLADGLRRWAEVLGGDPLAPGSGAAGGVGFAALTVLRAERRPGVQVLLDLLGFADAVRGAALVVTGEGALDEQSLHGKAPVGLARAARGVPVVAVTGRCELSTAQLRGAGFAAAYALTDLEPDRSRCLSAPGPLLEIIAGRIVEDHLCC